MTGFAWGWPKSRCSSLRCHRRPIFMIIIAYDAKHHIIIPILIIIIASYCHLSLPDFTLVRFAGLRNIPAKYVRVLFNRKSVIPFPLTHQDYFPTVRCRMKAPVPYLLPIIFPHFSHFITFHKYFPPPIFPIFPPCSAARVNISPPCSLLIPEIKLPYHGK